MRLQKATLFLLLPAVLCAVRAVAVEVPYSNDFSSNSTGVDPVNGAFSTGGSTWTLNTTDGTYEARPTTGAKFQNVAATVDVNPDNFGGDVSVAPDFYIHGEFEWTPGGVEFVNETSDRPDQFAVWFLGQDINTSIEDKYRLLVQADGYVALEKRFGAWFTLAEGNISSLVVGETMDYDVKILGDYIDTTGDTFNDSLALTAVIDAGEYGSETLTVELGPNGTQGSIFTESQVVIQWRDITSGQDLVGAIDYLEISNDLPELPTPTPGDYNGDGMVDLVDYTVWRNHLGADAATLADGTRDPSNSGVVNAVDYQYWKANFGATSTSGALSATAVPEPGSALLLVLAASIVGVRFRR